MKQCYSENNYKLLAENGESDELGNLIIDLLINGKIDNPMNANKFMNINTDVTFEMLSDDNIICAIYKNNDCFFQEETLSMSRVTDNKALKALDLVEMYLLQQPKDFVITNRDKSTVDLLRKKVSRYISLQKKRLTL
ncbi:5258_t:CDS:2 [Cetraspora pellucida]|uniref:5258_t:CDS:1 n=1 Tax=Cetraspora pellucida TaxID=1433469 RepID=A0A9N9I623_9GLOM|nr:5258_t:CDS:2 [Cetraspora pellucida]